MYIRKVIIDWAKKDDMLHENLSIKSFTNKFSFSSLFAIRCIFKALNKLNKF